MIGAGNAYFAHKYDNAIACLQDISNETELPIYLASDSKFGKSYYEHSSLPIRISNLGLRKGDPLHIDSDSYQGRDPSDFYQCLLTFISCKRQAVTAIQQAMGYYPFV